MNHDITPEDFADYYAGLPASADDAAALLVASTPPNEDDGDA